MNLSSECLFFLIVICRLPVESSFTGDAHNVLHHQLRRGQLDKRVYGCVVCESRKTSAFRGADLSSMQPPNTYCAWKSTSTGRSLLMTLSVKSSWSCTLKEMNLCEDRENEREGDRKDRTWAETFREEERDESEAAAGRRLRSFTEMAQTLRKSSREAI